MTRNPSVQLIVMILIAGVALVSSGCAKKQMVREEMTGKPAMEPMKEAAQPKAPPVAVKPKEELSQPAAVAPAPKLKEVPWPKPAARPAEMPFDLAGSRIQFAFDDYNLSRTSEANLDRIAEWLRKNPGIKVQIQGYTCNIGTDEYNLALGDERAESAEKYLERSGIESNRLSRISYGKEKPRVPNTDEENRSLNRRDEFVILKSS